MEGQNKIDEAEEIWKAKLNCAILSSTTFIPVL